MSVRQFVQRVAVSDTYVEYDTSTLPRGVTFRSRTPIAFVMQTFDVPSEARRSPRKLSDFVHAECDERFGVDRHRSAGALRPADDDRSYPVMKSA